MAEFDDNYSFLDKLLHRLAFNSVGLQLTLAANESDEYSDRLKALKVEKPVFITSLPRSGTTILLEVLSKTGVFCHHTYKDMPFVFTPLMWAKFSSKFAKDDTPRERAHGDGIQINQHSPEAFEEMFYKAHRPKLYQGRSLSLWPTESHKKFERFFREHIQKLMLRDDKPRYLSKNNSNITRLPYLKKLFPDGCFVIPFREPVQHARSLLRQHQNFLHMHQSNPFARDYMAGIGHFDFGANLKPVDFGGWHTKTRFIPSQLDFWLEYWIACYQYLLDAATFAHFVCFEQMCLEPRLAMADLAKRLQMQPDDLVPLAGQIEQGRPHEVDESALDEDNLSRARALYRTLSGQK